jgi:HK97 family phage prohead protease
MEKLSRPFEVKDIDEAGRLSGYASTFGNVDSDGDVIMPGAFQASINRARETGKYPKMLWQHDTRSIIGKWTAMQEDERGLKVEGQLILDVAQAREAYALAREGVLDSMSIGFNIPPDGAARAGMGRVISQADLWEVSLVTFPANDRAVLTSVKGRWTERDLERHLRDAGMPKAKAAQIVALAKPALGDQWDAGENVPDLDGAGALSELLTKLRRLSQ